MLTAGSNKAYLKLTDGSILHLKWGWLKFLWQNRVHAVFLHQSQTNWLSFHCHFWVQFGRIELVKMKKRPGDITQHSLFASNQSMKTCSACFHSGFFAVAFQKIISDLLHRCMETELKSDRVHMPSEQSFYTI